MAVKTISKPRLWRGLLTLTATACLLSVDAKSPAQQPPAQQPSTQQPSTQQPPAAVPSIEELRRQLEAKRLELKRQNEAQRQLDAKQQVEAKQQLEAKQKIQAAQQPLKSTPRERESTALAAPPRTPAPAADAASTPIPKNVLPVRLEPKSAAVSDSCPYPAAARIRGDTGTVVLLIYVIPDGRATDTRIETSSGSDALDEAAASCVKEYGHFLPKRIGERAEAGWFRMKFKWSFGD